ncbi:dual specificity protein phosphatase 10-like [Babylonia areolata]|uniref:dual specificity protein phosphatase 10-like n=1 Tax=Babylonia areolata TaxID=304850 RepID=UPI003FD6152E
MILLPPPHLHPHPHPLLPPPHPPPPPPPHPFELALPEVASSARAMPESGGDIEVLAPPRIHLASRRRFDLKLDLASALTGRERGEKKPRLDLLTAPAILSSKLTADSVTCSSCVGQAAPAGHDSPLDVHGGERPLSAASCLSHTTTTTTCYGQQTTCVEQQQHQHQQHTTCTFLAARVVTGGEEDRTLGPVVSSPVSPSSPPPPSLGVPGVPPFRAISSGELAAKLRKARPVLVIDCRPFLCYNAQHVQGAVNISCTDRFNRKRLQQGKVGVLELLTATHGKDAFRRRTVRDVVLYDERGSGQHVPPDTDSAMHIVLTTLHREGRQPAVLQGGMKQFEAEYPELCWNSRKLEMPGRLLCSPTNDTIEPEIETATASKVLPFLYLGNERDAAELERLRRHNITYVLNVTAHVPHYWHAHGIRYKRIPASDSAQQNLKQYFEEAIEFIDEARQSGASVLIHCHAGVSRSATITIAYILKHTKMAMSDAYKYVKSKRGIISPNFNFLGQLLEYEQDLNQGTSLRVMCPRLLEADHTV